MYVYYINIWPKHSYIVRKKLVGKIVWQKIYSHNHKGLEEKKSRNKSKAYLRWNQSITSVISGHLLKYGYLTWWDEHGMEQKILSPFIDEVKTTRTTPLVRHPQKIYSSSSGNAKKKVQWMWHRNYVDITRYLRNFIPFYICPVHYEFQDRFRLNEHQWIGNEYSLS